ncbi:hypothetical protein B296_00027394 [Ensete ventricosum]|uniref:Uncharacterized protein n=1 Tax=Ensete ventricosum TaxID=4639 RepID=A0A427AC46_ENSVE|nr:hypothetical protein B296_00027394 [Ensete ventricosum]
MFGRCCRKLTESSPEVYQEVHREFTDRLLGAHREFTGRMLGVRQEFVEGNQELAKSSLEGCREFIGMIGSESRCCLRGRGGHMHVVCMQRWLVVARPPAGAAGHGLATYKGRPAMARPLGAVAHKGLLPVASPVASMGDGAGHRGDRPLAGRLPTAKGSRRLCRGSGGDDAMRVKEGWGIFLRKR